ncbi:MAG: inositol monophosphatase [Calditrichia bacterium]|nr:inositol monophosphatase [Calditrichia bacterium]
MADYIDVAMKIARTAGQYLLDHKGQISRDSIDEKGRNDFVTFVDHQSEKLIVEEIHSHFPSHKILAEEGSSISSSADYRWIIDPLDGTKNFIQDIPIFCVSIAMEHQSKIVVGVVYDPVHDEIFSAEAGSGAYLNGKAIQISSRSLSESLIATGFPFKSKSYLPQYLLCFEEIFLKCSGMRRCGSAAIDLCYTAMGKFDGFWELGLSIWDMAAGSLIIREAGGMVSDFWGEGNYLNTGFIIAGNPEVHKNILKITKYYFRN